MGRIIRSADGRPLGHVGGRLRPSKPHALALHAPRYGLNLQNWPATPASTAYARAPAAQACLADILGNDRYGDCTAANTFHLQALRQAAAGAAVYHPPTDVVLAAYARDGGGYPTQDLGCDETVVLGNAQNLGFQCDDSGAVDKIQGYMVVDPTNVPLVRAVVTMFVGAAICADLCEQWTDPFPSPGSTWSVPAGGYVAVPANGHCFSAYDQTEKALLCGTWATPVELPFDALAACASSGNGGALYVLVDDEVLSAASRVAPDGADWATLIADFNALPSGVMVPPGP